MKKAKELLSSNLFLKVSILILIIIGIMFYFKIFYTSGVYFDGSFLEKEVIDNESHYRGKDKFGNIHIIVKGLEKEQGSAEVIYNLPNDIYLKYNVGFRDSTNWNSKEVHIEDENGDVIFTGEYRQDSPFLLDGKSGMPLMGDGLRIIVVGENPYNKDYTVPLINVVNMATYSSDTIRGQYEYFIIALLCFIITAIDMKFPLLFFTIRNSLSVKDPEPSDFYLVMQKISWYVGFGAGIVFMIIAIN